jgi:hypothetical protein
MIVENARIVIAILLFSCIAAVCVRSFWRNGNRIDWKALFWAFSFSVLILWLASEIFHGYANWRVSVYDANGNQSFSNDGRLDSHLYDRLVEIAIKDTGNALQPLGSIVVSIIFIILGQVLAYMLTPIRASIRRHK